MHLVQTIDILFLFEKSIQQLFGAFAWFWLMVPIVQSAWVLSRGGKRLVGPHMLLAAVSEPSLFHA